MSDDDKAKPRASLVGLLGPYAELYPSLGPRLRTAERSARPEIRRRLAALHEALEAREDRLRERLALAYGLTPTEIRLALHLALGGALAGYCELTGVSIGTARSQLKSVFAKTGVNRQAALAVLIGRP